MTSSSSLVHDDNDGEPKQHSASASSDGFGNDGDVAGEVRDGTSFSQTGSAGGNGVVRHEGGRLHGMTTYACGTSSSNRKIEYKSIHLVGSEERPSVDGVGDKDSGSWLSNVANKARQWCRGILGATGLESTTGSESTS